MFPHVELWRDRDFRRLWLAQAVSAFGARITREGLPIAAVLTLGATPAQIGLLAALSNGPALLVGLAAGGMIDRRRRRGVMMAADLARAAVLATLPVAAFLKLLALPHLYLAAALVGAASVLFEIADHAYLPALVRREDLTRANASLSATEAVAEIGGPALAGGLFQLLGGPFAIAANALSYLVSAVFLSGIRKPEPVPAPEPEAHWLKDIELGFGAALRHPLVRPIFAMSAAQSLFGGVFGALYIVFCLRVVGLTPGLLGVTIAMGGVGALVGAVVAGRLSQRIGVGPALIVSQGVLGVAVVLIPLSPAAVGPGMTVLIISQLLGDAAAVSAMILASTVRQSALPGGVLGRVGASFRAMGGGLAVAGALIGGVLGETLGVRGALWVGVAGIVASPLLGLSLRRMREMPSGPEDPAGG